MLASFISNQAKRSIRIRCLSMKAFSWTPIADGSVTAVRFPTRDSRSFRIFSALYFCVETEIKHCGMTFKIGRCLVYAGGLEVGITMLYTLRATTAFLL